MSNIVALVLLAASVWGFFGFVTPRYEAVKALKDERIAYQAALDKARELDALRGQLVSKYNSVSAGDLARLSKLLPDSVDNVRLIININNVANRYGMVIKDIKIDQPAGTLGRSSSAPNAASGVIAGQPGGAVSPGPSNYSVLPSFEFLNMSFSVSGPYGSFKGFLSDLERSLRVVDVTSISFTVGKGDFSTYDFKIKTYWLKQ